MLYDPRDTAWKPTCRPDREAERPVITRGTPHLATGGRTYQQYPPGRGLQPYSQVQQQQQYSQAHNGYAISFDCCALLWLEDLTNSATCHQACMPPCVRCSPICTCHTVRHKFLSKSPCTKLQCLPCMVFPCSEDVRCCLTCDVIVDYA